MANLAIQYVSPDRLRPYPGNARSHSRKQLKLIENSIKRFGFTNPILVTDDFEVIAGHGRLQAAKSLGMQLVPVVALSSLSDAGKKALIIADNRIAELSNWDRDILAIEYQGLHDLQFDDIEVTGFSLGEIDNILDEASEKKPVEPGPEDHLPPPLRHRFRERAIFGSLGPTASCAGTPAPIAITPGCLRAKAPIWY
jgi:ParB-like chromosome segregation protein Spo0J